MDNEVRDLKSGIVLILFSLITYFWLIPNQITVREGVSIGADYFPKLLVIVIGVSGTILVIQGIYHIRKNNQLDLSYIIGKDLRVKLKKYIPHAILLISAVGYLMLMQYLGFVLASIPFLTFLFIYFGHSKIIWCSVVSGIYITAVYLIFSNVFRIRFPMGPFGF